MNTKIEEVKSLFSNESYKQKTEPWFKFGKHILEGMKEKGKENCPVCDANISQNLDVILNDYNGYFDKKYEDFIKELDKKAKSVDCSIKSIKNSEENFKKLKGIHDDYRKSLEDFLFDEIESKFNPSTDILKNLYKSLEEKKSNVQNIFSLPENIKDCIVNFNSDLNSLNQHKKTMLDFLNSKKLNPRDIEDKIRKNLEETTLLEFNQGEKNKLEKYQNNIEGIKNIEGSGKESIPFWENILLEELVKIKAESRSISKHLKEMGIDHFSIDINEKKNSESIIVNYKNGIIKNDIKNNLSEGEKTALAFAYFLSKFENEISEEKKKRSTVIIDDPISSLDENRLYSTAHLIYNFFNKTKQLIVLSHNFLFLKFFNSFYRGNTNCLFLDKDKICKLPDEMQNFETPYFYMLKNIFDYLDESNDEVIYNTAKQHLPNFIRRVLETFLSFKFCRISAKEGSYKSPGLGELKDYIQKISMTEKQKAELNANIERVIQMTNIHSHGNAHSTQENFYISDDELKDLAKKAIDIIEKIDTLHYRLFSGISSG